jgi:hypothetical protein
MRPTHSNEHTFPNQLIRINLQTKKMQSSALPDHTPAQRAGSYVVCANRFEFEFQYTLPVSDNPDYGFVGNVNSPWGQVPPYAYGVHAGPVADLLNEYGIPAKAYKGYTLEQVIAQGALRARDRQRGWGNTKPGSPES